LPRVLQGVRSKALKRLARPWLLISVGSLFALYVLLGFYAVPRYIQGAIPELVETMLKRKASVGEVRFNPLLFKLELRDVALLEADDRPIGGFRHLLVDFELSSLLRWAWTFSTIVLDGLELHPDIAPDGRFNFAALADGKLSITVRAASGTRTIALEQTAPDALSVDGKAMIRCTQ